MCVFHRILFWLKVHTHTVPVIEVVIVACVCVCLHSVVLTRAKAYIYTCFQWRMSAICGRVWMKDHRRCPRREPHRSKEPVCVFVCVCAWPDESKMCAKSSNGGAQPHHQSGLIRAVRLGQSGASLLCVVCMVE